MEQSDLVLEHRDALCSVSMALCVAARGRADEAGD
jgi:hypothetical protein